MNNPFAFLAASGYAPPPPPMYPQQNPYAPQQGYAPQGGYDPQGGYNPQAGYYPQGGYAPAPQYQQPPPMIMMAPPPQPAGGGGSKTPAALTLVSSIMALMSLILPMASISALIFSISIYLWGISGFGISLVWWSAPPSGWTYNAGLLIGSFVMGLIGLILGFVATGLMFARKGPARIMAILTGIFCILAVGLFWAGLLSIGELTGVSPSVSTFTLIIGAVLAFVGGAMYKPAPDVPIMAGPMPGMQAPVPGYMPPQSPPPYPPY